MIISAALRSLIADLVVDQIDAGAGAGKVRIYDGTPPAGPDTAVSGQTLLAEITLNDPAFGAASSGVATVDSDPALEDASADATGTASWFRVLDSDNNAIFDGTVGTSGADMIVASTSFVATQPVEITSWTVTMPAS